MSIVVTTRRRVVMMVVMVRGSRALSLGPCDFQPELCDFIFECQVIGYSPRTTTGDFLTRGRATLIGAYVRATLIIHPSRIVDGHVGCRTSSLRKSTVVTSDVNLRYQELARATLVRALVAPWRCGRSSNMTNAMFTSVPLVISFVPDIATRHGEGFERLG